MVEKPLGGPAENAASSSWTSPLEKVCAATQGLESVRPGEFVRAPTDIGTPHSDSLFFPGVQSYPDTCAIRCQEFILEQFTGLPWDETVLVEESANHGWYNQGTSPEHIGNLLELHGVGVNRYFDASIYNLASELGQGHKVIIGVDSGELWDRNPILDRLSDALGIGGADHAVVVSGIDTSNPDDIRVMVSDPGTGQAVASYPMEQFLDAWEDSHFFMVSTQAAPPAYLHHPEMAHFDYAQGHIPQVAGVPWDDFLAMKDHPELWDQLTSDADTARDHAGEVDAHKESGHHEASADEHGDDDEGDFDPRESHFS